MYHAYVIYSKNYNRFYKGHCEDLMLRLKQHNSGATKSTKTFITWKLAYKEDFLTRNEAIIRERYFKTAAGRRYLKTKINL
jgi:putative endonuclease